MGLGGFPLPSRSVKVTRTPPRRFSSMFLAASFVQPDYRRMTKKNRVALAPFEPGQIWKLDGSRVEIGMVGKLLVHYRHFREKTPRVPTSLASKVKLEAFLRENKATLVGASRPQ
jgi:hypothetical protein